MLPPFSPFDVYNYNTIVIFVKEIREIMIKKSGFSPLSIMLFSKYFVRKIDMFYFTAFDDQLNFAKITSGGIDLFQTLADL